jgi:hypothetical protein
MKSNPLLPITLIMLLLCFYVSEFRAKEESPKLIGANLFLFADFPLAYVPVNERIKTDIEIASLSLLSKNVYNDLPHLPQSNGNFDINFKN